MVRQSTKRGGFGFKPCHRKKTFHAKFFHLNQSCNITGQEKPTLLMPWTCKWEGELCGLSDNEIQLLVSNELGVCQQKIIIFFYNILNYFNVFILISFSRKKKFLRQKYLSHNWDQKMLLSAAIVFFCFVFCRGFSFSFIPSCRQKITKLATWVVWTETCLVLFRLSSV